MITRVKNAKIISDEKIINGSYLYFDEDKIIDITNEELSFDKEIDAKGNFISAGFIDIHVHGGGGYDFMDGGVEPILKASYEHLKHGTTTIYPTSCASSTDATVEFLKDVKLAIRDKRLISNIYGVHLEAPYLSLKQAGAQNPDYIKNPQKEEYEKIVEVGKGVLKRWSYAPELEGAKDFLDFIHKSGIISSIAHSDAIYDDVEMAYNKGTRLVTHLYSGMSTITREMGFRRLGVIESSYLFDDLMVEVIADSKHLPPILLKLILKHKGSDNICLITDAMRAAGLGEGESYLGKKGEEVKCIVEDAVAKLLDRSAFAGSVATADMLIKTFVKNVGISIEESVKMLTKNPAKIMGLTKKGDIIKGYDSDFVIFDDDINIKNVIVRGKELKDYEN